MLPVFLLSFSLFSFVTTILGYIILLFRFGDCLIGVINAIFIIFFPSHDFSLILRARHCTYSLIHPYISLHSQSDISLSTILAPLPHPSFSFPIHSSLSLSFSVPPLSRCGPYKDRTTRSRTESGGKLLCVFYVMCSVVSWWNKVASKAAFMYWKALHFSVFHSV